MPSLVPSLVARQVISGCSGGAVIAAFVCTRTDAELREALVDPRTVDAADLASRFTRWWETIERSRGEDLAAGPLRATFSCVAHVTTRGEMARRARIASLDNS